MTKITVTPYQKQKTPPTDPASLRLYYEQELTKIQVCIQALVSAIQQLQSATSLPIT